LHKHVFIYTYIHIYKYIHHTQDLGDLLAQAWVAGDFQAESNQDKYVEWEADFLDRFENHMIDALQRRDREEVYQRHDGARAPSCVDVVG
jgi:hypothetical protein